MKVSEATLVSFPQKWLQFDMMIDAKRLCRDLTGMGRRGNGDVEVALKSLDELPDAMGLVRQSCERQMGDGGRA